MFVGPIKDENDFGLDFVLLFFLDRRLLQKSHVWCVSRTPQNPLSGECRDQIAILPSGELSC